MSTGLFANPGNVVSVRSWPTKTWPWPSRLVNFENLWQILLPLTNHTGTHPWCNPLLRSGQEIPVEFALQRSPMKKYYNTDYRLNFDFSVILGVIPWGQYKLGVNYTIYILSFDQPNEFVGILKLIYIASLNQGFLNGKPVFQEWCRQKYRSRPIRWW